MRVKLPEPLQLRYEALIGKFSDVKDTYSLYADEMIPEDPEYMRQILEFIIEILDHMDINHETLNLTQWGLFLSEFPNSFEYGDPQDVQNYLDSDEIDVISNLQGFGGEEAPDLKRITSVRKKFEKALRQIE